MTFENKKKKQINIQDPLLFHFYMNYYPLINT